MTHVDTPQTRCRVGVARCDITPPVGIYHRMWGAAAHDKATGVHRPLTATALWLEPLTGDAAQAQLIIGLDHCVIDSAEMQKLRDAASLTTNIAPGQVHITLSHTHGSGWMSRSRSHFPGGDLIGPYLDDVIKKIAGLAKKAQQTVQPATVVYGSGRCRLAANRDYFDAQRRQFVCGYNPQGAADDLVMIARISAGCIGVPSSAPADSCLATIVNYACHPTTLAWDNTLISPDYVGATREVIEKATAAPCLFLQGASGDLGPREGFVGDLEIADRNGRQLGYAALSALESLPPTGTRFLYRGPVVSGTTIGTWHHEFLDGAALGRQQAWQMREKLVELPYRHDLPGLEETKDVHSRWQKEEEKASAAGNLEKARDCRARVEQAHRQITRLSVLPDGKVFPFRMNVSRFGDAIWVLTPGELYSSFQVALRSRFPQFPVIVTTLTNDWQPGYVPAAWSYGYGVYQETIACVAAGSLEVVIEAAAREIATMV